MFFTILMYEESFSQYVHNDEKILKIVKGLFVEDEYKTYISSLSDLRRCLCEKNLIPSSNDILNILAPLTLKCDAIGYIWESINSLK